MHNLFKLIIGLVLLSACNNGEMRVGKKEFPKHIVLTATKIKIEQVIKPMSLAIHGDFLIIQNERIPEAPCFYVYALDSLEYLFSFGSLGGSEEEFVAPRIIFQDKDNALFSVFDQRTRDVKMYDITDKGASLKIGNIKVNEPTGYPLQELAFLNDSILLYLTVDNYLVSYNITGGNIIDSTSFETGLESILGDKYNQSIDFFHFFNHNNKIVMGHNFIDKLSLNECADDGIFKHKLLSLKGNKPYNITNKLYENVCQYTYVNSTSDWIFAQYSGYKFKALQPFPINMGKRHFDFLMEVYDWDLNPKAQLEFDNDILRFVIDEDRKRIITWDPLKDFDYLLIYNYEI